MKCIWLYQAVNMWFSVVIFSNFWHESIGMYCFKWSLKELHFSVDFLFQLA